MRGYTRTVFREVSLRSRWTFRCSKCSKRLVRSRKFWQTLNPWNVHKNGPLNGQPKDESAILAALRIEIDKWKASDRTCAACSGTGKEQGR